MNKLYTAQELKRKYKELFIDVYPHHHEYWNEKLHKYETVWEVRRTSKTRKENYQTVEEILT